MRQRLLTTSLAAVMFLLIGCGENVRKAPPKVQIQSAVAAKLPPFLSLESVETETIASDSANERVKVNFKATVVPKETLYQLDREAEGKPKVTLIAPIQGTDTKVTLYGEIGAKRTLDNWDVLSVNFTVNPDQFGQPKANFHAGTFVTGSDEATAALKRQADNAAAEAQAKLDREEQQAKVDKARREREAEARKAQEEQQARDDKARQEREEKARIAFEAEKAKQVAQQKIEDDKRKEAEEAAKQKLLLATIKGARYVGTISHGDQRQRVSLVITEQKDFMVGAEITNPNNSINSLTFTGELSFDPKPERDGALGYPIVMSAVPGKGSYTKNL